MMNTEVLLGQEKITEYFEKAIETNRIPHSIIISGEKGSNKYQIAKSFALEVLGTDATEHPDVITVDLWNKPSKQSFVNEIREEIVNKKNLAPVKGKKKFFIVLGANLMSAEAQNALLKSLEDPPEYVSIILLSEDANKLLPTIRSRSVILHIAILKTEQIYQILKDYGKDETIAKLCAGLSLGNLRRAQELSEDMEYLDYAKRVLNITYNLAMGKSQVYLNKEIRELGQEIENFLQIVEIILRDVLVYKLLNDKGEIILTPWSDYIVEISNQVDLESLGRIRERLTESRYQILNNPTKTTKDVIVDLILSELGGNVEKISRNTI